MNEEEWLDVELEKLVSTSHDYKQKALLQGVRELLHEQKKRTEQLQGRLDGELWSPSKWE